MTTDSEVISEFYRNRIIVETFSDWYLLSEGHKTFLRLSVDYYKSEHWVC